MRRRFCALLLLLAMGCMTPPAMAQGCLKRAERQAAIASGQAMRLNDALRRLQGSVSGRVVGAELCHAGAGLIYRIRILEPGGTIRVALIDAKSGQVLSLK